MKIKEVENSFEAKVCNQFLSKLIKDESNYDTNLKKDYIVENYFENMYERDDNQLLIALVDQKIVGYLFTKILFSAGPEKENEALIDGIYVLEEYRRRKIASKLIEETKKWCKEKGIKVVSIKSIIKNEAAIHLYHKEGFLDFALHLKTTL